MIDDLVLGKYGSVYFLVSSSRCALPLPTPFYSKVPPSLSLTAPFSSPSSHPLILSFSHDLI